ncbi:MAG: TGS domain-containing protein, partial [Candidatus Acidiferrales bacterium]
MTDTIQITFPDGSVKPFPRGTSPADIAKQISPRLAKEVLVACLGEGNNAVEEERLWDLARPLEASTKLALLKPDDPDALYVMRHSCAHLLAAAVLELYPETKFGIGPPVENGFYYDFARDEPFTPDDLARIEAKMRELAAADIPNQRRMLPKADALKLYTDWPQQFKCELIEEKAAGQSQVSFYQSGKFIDFCLGPHIPSMGRLKAFKLMSIAGAYWKG